MFWVLSLFIFEIFTSLYLCIFYLSIFGIGGCLDCLDCLEGVQGCFFLSHWSHPFSVKTRKNTPPPPSPRHVGTHEDFTKDARRNHWASQPFACSRRGLIHGASRLRESRISFGHCVAFVLRCTMEPRLWMDHRLSR